MWFALTRVQSRCTYAGGRVRTLSGMLQVQALADALQRREHNSIEVKIDNFVVLNKTTK
jgi:hypothetical protein